MVNREGKEVRVLLLFKKRKCSQLGKGSEKYRYVQKTWKSIDMYRDWEEGEGGTSHYMYKDKILDRDESEEFDNSEGLWFESFSTQI